MGALSDRAKCFKKVSNGFTVAAGSRITSPFRPFFFIGLMRASSKHCFWFVCVVILLVWSGYVLQYKAEIWISDLSLMCSSSVKDSHLSWYNVQQTNKKNNKLPPSWTLYCTLYCFTLMTSDSLLCFCCFYAAFFKKEAPIEGQKSIWNKLSCIH